MFSPARGALLLLLLLAGCGRFLFDDRGPDASATDVSDCGHTFCDDFDRSGLPQDTWDSLTMTGGTVAFASDTSVSAPQSLLFTVPTDGTTLTGNAFLHKQLPLTTTKATVHVQMQYGATIPMNAEVDLVRLHWNALPNGCMSFGYYLVRDGTKPLNLQETYVDAGGTGSVCAGGSVQNLTSNFDNSASFNDVTMEITFGAVGTSHVKLTLNGAVLVDAAAAHPIEPSALTLDLGAGVARNGLSPWTVRYDDLTVDLN